MVLENTKSHKYRIRHVFLQTVYDEHKKMYFCKISPKKVIPKKVTSPLNFCYRNNFLVAFCHKDKVTSQIYAKLRIFYTHQGQFQVIHLLFSSFWRFPALLG
jgi:hypothetical protein